MQTKAANDVLFERMRQIVREGYNDDHDDVYATGEELASAAMCYATPPGTNGRARPDAVPAGWPWEARFWKPGERRRELVKAAALLLAEIERIDRFATS